MGTDFGPTKPSQYGQSARRIKGRWTLATHIVTRALGTEPEADKHEQGWHKGSAQYEAHSRFVIGKAGIEDEVEGEAHENAKGDPVSQS